jgi:hypothetical protein
MAFQNSGFGDPFPFGVPMQDRNNGFREWFILQGMAEKYSVFCIWLCRQKRPFFPPPVSASAPQSGSLSHYKFRDRSEV